MLAFFELEEWEEKMVREAFPNERLLIFREPLRAEHIPLLCECDQLCVFIYSSVNAEVLAQLPKCAFVATMSTGYDHIDVATCKQKNITVSNVPTYGDHTVAEHTFVLMLALTRKLVPSVEQVRRGDFTPETYLRGNDLQGKTIGVIGTGKIGRNVIRIARGFDMQVIAFDPFPNPELQKQYDFTYVSLPELLSKSDIVTVHVPLLPTTKHLLDTEAINKMKQGVIVLNTSRGGIIETQALYNALMTGKVAAAGLDVLEDEVLIKEEKQLLSQQFPRDINYRMLALNHLLVMHPNVIVTPHNAFNSHEALERIIRTTIENIKAFRAGTPQNAVH